MTFKFDGWPRKTIGHLFCTTSSFVHHFKPIGDFKLQLQSRNAQFGSKLTIICPVWPWNLMDDINTIGHLFYATSSFVNRFKAICEFKLEWQYGNAQFRLKSAIFVPCDLEISRMTLENNGASFLCYFKISAACHSHLWIWTGVTVRKIPVLGQNRYFLSLWPWNLTDNLEKQQGTYSMLRQSLCIFS